MKILFVDQTAKLSGGELALLDIVCPYRKESKVILFEDGPLNHKLQSRQVETRIVNLSCSVKNIRRASKIPLSSIYSLIKISRVVASESSKYDFIFANSQKAALVSALAGKLARKPVVWYLHDILSSEHFGKAQLTAAKYISRNSTQILVNSEATKIALQKLTGRTENVHLVYNAFSKSLYSEQTESQSYQHVRTSLGFDNRPLIGLFGRLTPWKGQEIFLKALAMMPDVQGVIVGSSMFGEEKYAEHLGHEILRLGLSDRVKMTGFRNDVPDLMQACDIIAHTSVAPEPFGRVIVEGMLAGKPVVATATGGPDEIIENGVTGKLYAAGDSEALYKSLNEIINNPHQSLLMAQRGKESARQRFSLEVMHKKLDEIMRISLGSTPPSFLGASV